MKTRIRPIYLLVLFSLPCTAQVKPFPNPEDSAKVAQSMSYLQAQEHIPKGPQAIQSPTAASLGSHGEIPVTLFTGKPEISINLHNLSDGEISIPLTLNYDASGVRPDQHPGWVGLNFNLSANYVITRTIRDAPDDNKPNASTLGEHGYAFHTALIQGNDWFEKAGMLSIANATVNQMFIDTEPDEFNFQAPGLSGKFYLGSDAKWKIQCDRPVRVQLINSGTPLFPPFTPPAFTGNQWDDFNNHHYAEHYEGFVITDDLGTKYTFGGSDNGFTEYSMDFFNQGKSNWTCNAWYLKSIVRQTGQTTSFAYERGDFVAQMYFSIYNKMVTVNGGVPVTCVNWSSLIGQMGPYSGKLISPIYLKEIVSERFKVVFTSTVTTELSYTQDIFEPYINGLMATIPGFQKRDYLTYLFDCFYPVNSGPANCNNPSLAQLTSKLKWRKLDKIQVQNGSGMSIKEFEFTYNNILTERLMLFKVQEKSGYNASKLPPYEFSYYTDVLKLPGYGKSHTDHWGFNNGKLINSNADFNAFDTYGINFRSPAALSKYGRLSSLTQIKYPSGGISKFWFEPHTFSKEVKPKRWEGEDVFPSNQLAGGLRIKEIHTYDPVSTDPVIVKKYYYLAAFNAASPDTSSSSLSSGVLGGKAQYYWPAYKPMPEGMNISVEEDIFSTQSVLPASENSMGSHIGYSQVVERSSAEGWSVHQFSNFDNGYRDEAPLGFLQPSSTPYQPHNNKAYTRGKELSVENFFQNGNLASKTVQQYAAVGPAADYTARSVKTLLTFLCMTNNKVYEGTASLIDVRKFLPIQISHYLYDQDSPANVASSVVNHTYWPNGQRNTSGQSDSKGRIIKTAYKFSPNLADPVSAALVTRNIIAPEREVFRYTGPDAAPVPIRLTSINYDLFAGAYRPQKVETRITNAASFHTDIDFLTYDARGNLLTYREQSGAVTKLEYYGIADIGKADLLKKQTVADGTASAQTISYIHKALVGVESIQDPNAKVLFYEYDAFNRLKNTRTTHAAGAIRSSLCYNYAGQVVDCAALAPVGSLAATTLVLIAEAALPVKMIDFRAVRQENTSALFWATSAETHSDRFEIERSPDGKDWLYLGFVPAKGESEKEAHYSFVDQMPRADENLYRLKMVDRDSTFAYSRIQAVSFEPNGKVTLYPNPLTVGNQLHIETADHTKIASISCYDVSGKQVLKAPGAEFLEIGALAAGMYTVQITYTDGSATSHRIVKQ